MLSRVNPRLTDARFLIVEPVSRGKLAAIARAIDGCVVTGDCANASSGAEGDGGCVVVADYLGPRMGSLVAFVEGREGSAPWAPDPAPVDSYLSLIVDAVDYRPLKNQKGG